MAGARTAKTIDAPYRLALSVARTSPGTVRASNEDCFLTRDDIGLWAIADGMGGHQRGEVASRMVVDSLAALPAFNSGFAFLSGVRDALDDTNRRLVETAAFMAGDAVIGSTVVALLAFDGRFACVWAGDSRAYRLRRGGLEQITRDHSIVQELIDRGELAPEDARSHRHANVVTRAVGGAIVLDLEIAHGIIEPGDLFLLCSDGLTGPIPDGDLATLVDQQDLHGAADALIARALQRGASDNVTLVLVKALQ